MSIVDPGRLAENGPYVSSKLGAAKSATLRAMSDCR